MEERGPRGINNSRGQLLIASSDHVIGDPEQICQALCKHQKVSITPIIQEVPRPRNPTALSFTMGKILQKKKNRSGLSKARPKNNRLKNGHRKVNVLGNAIIAENWYAQLG